MCEITYDNLTICIGFLDDLCTRRTAKKREKGNANSTRWELRGEQKIS